MRKKKGIHKVNCLTIEVSHILLLLWIPLRLRPPRQVILQKRHRS